MSLSSSKSKEAKKGTGSSQEEEEVTCRICLNATFESDASKLDRGSIVDKNGRNSFLKLSALSEMMTPCLCTGSMGLIHKGCLLLEVQFRRSADCQVCKTPYTCVDVRKTGGLLGNSVLAYAGAHFFRSLATLVLCLAVPFLTTLWFCNRIHFCALRDAQEAGGNGSFRVVKVPGRSTKTDYEGQEGEEQEKPVYGHQRVHPLLVLVFTYHADVLWINLVNLMLIQLILHNLEHYQRWAVDHRPRVAIHLTD